MNVESALALADSAERHSNATEPGRDHLHRMAPQLVEAIRWLAGEVGALHSSYGYARAFDAGFDMATYQNSQETAALRARVTELETSITAFVERQDRISALMATEAEGQ